MLRTFIPGSPIQPPKFTGKCVLVTGGSGFIGANLLLRLVSEPAVILNLDLRPPPVAALRARRRPCEMTDEAATPRAIVGFAPHYVLHLAGRTDVLGKTLTDYAANTMGSRNVVEACRASGSIERFILTSSQFVCGPGPLPASDIDFRPHTIYSESKVVAERESSARSIRVSSGRSSGPPTCGAPFTRAIRTSSGAYCGAASISIRPAGK